MLESWIHQRYALFRNFDMEKLSDHKRKGLHPFGSEIVPKPWHFSVKA